MSFLKNLFEKHKDSKYGKGHRLGDAKQQASEPSTSRGAVQAQPAVSLRSNNEAAMKAAEAAMQRMQAKSTTPRVNSAARAAAQSQLDQDDKEMKKALELKEHYFGKPKLVEAAPMVKKNRIFYKSLVLPGQRYTKEEIENRVEQTLLDQMESDPILASVTLLYTANHKQTEKLSKCKETMNKIADNILNNPDEEKYRKIRIENKVFNENVYALKYAQIVLSNAGFETRRMPVKEEEPDVVEDFYVFDSSADLTKLESLKSALVLSEPVLPELDRDIKIFKPGSIKAQASYNIRDEYDIEDFFNLKVEDMLKEQQLRNEMLEKQGMLRTKAMRERDEQLELKRYIFCLIRVKFPDDYILEALFRTNETLSDLYDLIAENLAHDNIPFELAGPSLKKPSGPETTLAAAGLAPASLLYFKISELASQEVENLSSKIKTYLKF